MDIKAVSDALVLLISQYYPYLLAGAVLLVLFGNNPIRHRIERALSDNWQLTLLAATGIALSLASAYTTFDGLRNFTSAPLLSVFIAFGVQGVMLIVAWLIGESFAVGMNQKSGDGRRLRLVDATVGMLLGIALVGIAFYWVLHQYKALRITPAGVEADMVRISDVATYFLFVLVLVGMLVIGFRRGGEISTPYVQSLRLIVKNAVLWVMFLASMTASVFFSFDSHFNAIFPAEQRKRAAEIRTMSQIGGVIADVGALTQKRQIEEAGRLFSTEGWKAYDQQLAALAQTAQGAQGELEKYFVQQMEQRRRAIAEQQERVATAQSGQAGLAVKKVSLGEEFARLKADRPGLAADYAQHKSELDAKAKEIDAKRVEGMAEDRGVEGTMKQGRGPVYRQRMSELAILNDQYRIAQERTKDAHKRLLAVETRLAQIDRELSTLDGDLAKLKGEAQTAEQRIKAAELAGANDEGARVDPARVLPTFERARAAFRQRPDVQRLAELQQQCAQLLGALSGTTATKERVRFIDCNPKQAAEASARVFALNTGLAAYHDNCAGGDKLAQHTTTDALLGFGRKCLQDSGLISRDSAAIGASLAAIDMNRDDKAHRFVVTWNAFLDGNRLAYLSLVLAIGVDALVFMSGLFGAQALRSPLSDVPGPKARSAHQLQAIIDAALLPDTFNKARMAREAMHPMAPVDGFTNVVKLGELHPENAAKVRDVLNAGATIGAVRHTQRADTYLVRAELYEYLCEVIKRELKQRPEDAKRDLELNELETRMTEALLPSVGDTADAVLRHLHPIESDQGFTAEIFINEVESRAIRPVRNVLTAGSSLRVVRRDKKEPDRYYVHGEFYKALARIRARSLIASSVEHVTWGGRLEANRALSGDDGRLLAQADRAALAASSDELLRQVQETLLEALGLGPSALERLREPGIAGQALAAAQALKLQAPTHHGLNEQLKLVEGENKRALENAHGTLAAHFADDGSALDLLRESAAEIHRLLPALTLLPEGGLFDRLVAALEEALAENALSGDEDLLLKRLRRLKSDLGTMDWSDQRAWKGVRRQIDHLNEAGPAASIAAAQTGGKLH